MPSGRESRVWYWVGQFPQAKRSSNEKGKKSTFSKCTEVLRKGPPSLYLTAAAAYKLLEANPVTKLAFPNGKNRRWQTVTYSQAHTPTKHPVSNIYLFKENFKHTGWENSYTLNKDANFYPEVKPH